MPNASRRILLRSTALLLSGCAATVTAPSGGDAIPVARSSGAVRHITMVLARAGNLEADGNWVAFREEWQTAMAAHTGAAGVGFTLDPAVGCAAGRRRHARRAGAPAGQRFPLRLAGQALRPGRVHRQRDMDVEARFAEAPSGRALGSRRFTTSSSAWQGVFSAMTPKQVEAGAREIVQMSLQS